MPAMPNAFDIVLTTIRLGWSATSGAADQPTNSAYASSTTTMQGAPATRRSSSSGGVALAVGLLGLQYQISLAPSAAASRPSTSARKPSSSGTRRSAPPSW